MDTEPMVFRFSVDKNLFVAPLDDIAGHAHNAFDIVLAGIFRVSEDDDVTALDASPACHFHAHERDVHSVGQFVDEQVVPDLDRGQHGTGRAPEGLDDRRANDEGHADGKQKRLDVLPQPRFRRGFGFSWPP